MTVLVWFRTDKGKVSLVLKLLKFNSFSLDLFPKKFEQKERRNQRSRREERKGEGKKGVQKIEERIKKKKRYFIT